MKRGAGTDDPTAEPHDPADSPRFTLGQPKRPQLPDRCADHVDPIKAQGVEGAAEDRRRDLRVLDVAVVER